MTSGADEGGLGALAGGLSDSRLRRRFWWPSLLALAALTYLYHLDGLYIPRIGDEAPYIQIVRLTAESGQWLPLRTPPAFENTKPPFLFWMGMVSTDQARQWSLFRLRLPIVVCTFLTSALVFFLARRLSGETEVGYLAALTFLGFSSTFQYGRPFLTNLPETLFVFFPFFLVVAFHDRLEAWGTGSWLLMGLSLGVACLIKSFVLVVPAGLALAWFRLAERGRDLGEFVRKDLPNLILVVAVALASFALWPLLDPNPRSVIDQFVLEENVGKVARGGYLRGLLSGPYPLYRIWLGPLANAGLFALPVLQLVIDTVKRRRHLPREEKALWILVLSFLIVYSIPAQRQENYLLPVAPALAVLLAARWAAIDRWWFYLFQVPALVGLLALYRLMLEVGGRALPESGYGAWQMLVPILALAVSGGSFVHNRSAPHTFHLLALLALLSVSCAVAPFEGPAGRFDPQRAALLTGKTVYVPSDFVAKYERHRFILPGARIEGYDPNNVVGLDSLLRSRQFVALHRPLGESVAGPYRVFARRLDLKTRHSMEEILRILLHKDLDALVHQEIVVRRLTPKREQPEVAGEDPG